MNQIELIEQSIEELQEKREWFMRWLKQDEVLDQQLRPTGFTGSIAQTDRDAIATIDAELARREE